MSMVIDARVRLPAEFRPADAAQIPAGQAAGYGAVFGADRISPGSVQQLHADLGASGVDHAIVHAEYEYGDPADAMNEGVAHLVATARGRLSGFGTVSLAAYSVLRAVRQVDRVADLRLLGVNIQPSFFGLVADDRLLYPVYAKAAERGLVVAIHTGIHYDRARPIEGERPVLLDRVACDFPELTLIACHAGWPWVAEMVAVARRHPQVLLEFGAVAPKYIGAPGSGWEVAFRLMNNVLADQVLFATDWPVFAPAAALQQWRSLGLRPSTLEALLGGNAEQRLIRRHLSSSGGDMHALGAGDPRGSEPESPRTAKNV